MLNYGGTYMALIWWLTFFQDALLVLEAMDVRSKDLRISEGQDHLLNLTPEPVPSPKGRKLIRQNRVLLYRALRH
jgi:hypothetical protein